MSIFTIKEKFCKKNNLQFEELQITGYEKIFKIRDEKSGLTAIIALHDLTLGMALGGIRIYPYDSFNSALVDALRLSKGMTHKSAIANVGFGGGKSVIIADPKKDKTKELLMSFGYAVDSLNGQYICAEDMGCSTDDVMVIKNATNYVVGLPHKKSSGDPAVLTAYGVFRGIQASLKFLYNTDSLIGKKVAVQGLGSVGMNLCSLLYYAGAKIIVTDVDVEKVEIAKKKFRAFGVVPEKIYEVDCDIFSPCALGGILNSINISKLRTKIIAGAANNQLYSDLEGRLLKKKGILYAPDFVINAGGLLNVSVELEKNGYSYQRAKNIVAKIYDSLLAIYEIAKSKNVSTNEAAVDLAKYKIRFKIGKRSNPPHFHHTL
jgi:leucine dehydrogenase